MESRKECFTQMGHMRSVSRKTIIISRNSGPLPDYRINPLHAFKCTGLDYAGPLFTKNKTGTTFKDYILLFTSASSRALHLELTRDMKALAFINRLKDSQLDEEHPMLLNDNFKTFKSFLARKFMFVLEFDRN